MFLLNTLTVPIIKDLVNKPNEQYRDIFATLNNNNNNKAKAPIPTEQNMTEELSLFLNDLKKKGGENNTVVGGRNPQGAALSNPKGSTLSNPKGAALSNPKGAALSNPYDGENYNSFVADASSFDVVGRDPPSSVVGGRNPLFKI